ncbi:hypothetical protein [Streptomyces sp. NPDC058305]|uniref:hypothetical protein n=1 Tax=Streptomyces sp. NPDC058305 TaxID=3346438 RepID=UPI0036EAB45C
MTSEVTVEDDCISAYWELKAKRDVNTVICRLDDGFTTCRVERLGNLTPDELVLTLPVNEPRLAFYDLPFATVDGTRQSRVLLVSWLPEKATSQSRAAYSQAVCALVDKLDGSELSVRAREAADLAYDRLASHARAGKQTGDGAGGIDSATTSGGPGLPLPET